MSSTNLPLERLAEALLEENVPLAFIFGSVARGTPHAQSDIDLVIDYEATSLTDWSTLRQRLEAAAACSIDLFSLHDLESEPWRLLNILSEARPLIDHVDFFPIPPSYLHSLRASAGPSVVLAGSKRVEASWRELLRATSLLHACHLKEEDYLAKTSSLLLDDQVAIAALEGTTDTFVRATTSVLRELLLAHGIPKQTLKPMNEAALIAKAQSSTLLPLATCQQLETLRAQSDERQIRRPFLSPSRICQQLTFASSSIDSILENLVVAFAQIGVDLMPNLPAPKESPALSL